MPSRTLRRLAAALCCAALLLPCLPAALAEDALMEDGFENYASQAALLEAWPQVGSTQTGLPQISTEEAHSGACSLLLDDTETTASLQVRRRAGSGSAAEHILSAWYKLENASGIGRTSVKLYAASGSAMTFTYSSGRWDRLSAILPAAPGAALYVFLSSNAAPKGRLWFDDVAVRPLTEELALDYIEEKLAIPGVPDVMAALQSAALGLNGADGALEGVYALTLRARRTEKGAPLTRPEIQACVDAANTRFPSRPPTDGEIVDAAAELLDLSPWLNEPAHEIRSDLPALPSALGGGIAVTWQALDPATGAASAALTASGRVARPGFGQGDAPVLLRAALQKGDETRTRDFGLIVAGLDADDARILAVVNPGFEQDAPADETVAPAGWIKEHPWIDTVAQTKSVYANVDADRRFTGRQSLRLTGGTGSAPELQSEFVWDADEGRLYRLDAMACALSADDAPTAVLNFRDNEGLVIGSASASYPASGGYGVWKQLTADAVAPVGTAAITVNFRGGSGAAWLDDVRVREFPLVRNGSFALGTAGWAAPAAAENGRLTLTGGSAAGTAAAVTPGMRCFLTGAVTGSGALGLRFTDKSGAAVGEYFGMAGSGAVWAHVPAEAAAAVPVLVGPGTFTGLEMTLAPYGSDVADGGFEDTAAGFCGSPWTLTNAAADPDSGKDGAGLTVRSGGSVVSNAIPVLSGKRYVVAVDVKGAGTLGVTGYGSGKSGVLQFHRQADASGSGGWERLTVELDPVPEGTGREVGCIRVELSGSAVFDNAAVRAVTDSVSNPSFEILNGSAAGTFPVNWSAFGTAAVRTAHGAGQFTHGIRGVAVERFGRGEGGVRSSLIRSIVPGEAYEASVRAMGTGALSIQFYNADFALLESASASIDSRSWQKISVTAAAPALAAYAALSAGGEGAGTLYVDEAFFAPAARPIGQNTQLFFDDYLIASADCVTRTFHEGEKTGPLFTGAFGTWAQMFGSSIVFDPDALPYGQSSGTRGVYKMWYQNASGYRAAYAESTDGRTWTAPALGLAEYNGNTDNNLCAVNGTTDALVHLQSVWIDREGLDPARRYLGIVFNGVQSTTEGRYSLWVSPDGFTWDFDRDLIVGQDVSTMVYDPYHKQFIGTFKITFGKRTHRIALSRDNMQTWSTPVRMYSVVVPQDTAGYLRADGYTNGIWPVGDSWVGFSWRYRINEVTYGGVIDAPFLFSRDLTEDWQTFRKPDGTAQMAVSLGAPGEFDCGMANMGGSMIDMGDEVWFYYTGWNGDHNTGIRRVPAIGAAKWRKDGFVSMDFGPGGTLTTAPFVLAGTQVHLNAEAGGVMHAELLDTDGALLASASVTGNRVDHTLVWDRNVADLKGRTVRLRLTADDARLWSLRCDDVPPDEPPAPSGDLNGDGKVNGKDAVMLQRFLAGGYGVTLTPAEADLTGDGKVNGKDAVLLQRFLAGGYGVTLG